MAINIWSENAFDYARDLQLQEYLNQPHDDSYELLRCNVCGGECDEDKVVLLSGGHYACEECVASEMEYGDYSLNEAIKQLTILCNTKHKSFALPKLWKDYLLDETDRIETIPEADKFLTINCPEGYYLHNIRYRKIEGNFDNLEYYFSWRKMII